MPYNYFCPVGTCTLLAETGAPEEPHVLICEAFGRWLDYGELQLSWVWQKRRVVVGMTWKGIFPSWLFPPSLCFPDAMPRAAFFRHAPAPCHPALEPASNGLKLLHTDPKSTSPLSVVGVGCGVSVTKKWLRQIFVQAIVEWRPSTLVWMVLMVAESVRGTL